LDSNGENFECVVRIQNFALTFDGAAQEAERRKVVEETLRKLQVDIFNVVKKYEDIFHERRNVFPLDRLRDEVTNEVEDSEISLKIEEKPKTLKDAAGYS
jgi:septum formation topological specificity factor MinE